MQYIVTLEVSGTITNENIEFRRAVCRDAWCAVHVQNQSHGEEG